MPFFLLLFLILSAGPLRAAAPAAREPVARAWMRDRLGAERAAAARLVTAVPAGRDAAVLHFQDTRDGLPVFQSDCRLLVRADGAVTCLEDNGAARRAAEPAPGAFRMNAAAALAAAGGHLGVDADPAQARPERVLHRRGAGEPAPGWLLQVPTADGQHHWNLLVDDATGRVVWQQDWALQCRLITTPLPEASPDTRLPEALDCFPDPSASPHGWFDLDGVPGADSTTTRGVNVSAQEDGDGNNIGGTRAEAGAGLDFVFPFDPNLPPTRNQNAAIAHSFALHNHLHDLLWYHGFGPVDGNYQAVNRGEGGLGGDPVLVDVLDGAGSNNAITVSPADGQSGQLNFYIFSRPQTVQVLAPFQASFAAAGAAFGGGLPVEGLQGSLVRAIDASTAGGPSTNDACSTILNASALAGKIALVDRGTCTFLDKVRNCQAAGAVAVIVANNSGSTLVPMTGSDPALVIPAVFIGQTDGNRLRLALSTSTVEVALFGEPFRDSSLDNTLAIHEHGHLITQRLAGGPANPNCLFQLQGGGLSEGWSDWYALVLTARASDTPEQPRVIGAYCSGNATLGIRRYPYTADLQLNPLTYSSIGTLARRHDLGEVWCSLLWDVYWEVVGQQGFSPDFLQGDGGNQRMLRLVNESLKLIPCDPTFVQARDALLHADQLLFNSEHACAIWRGFARRGLGQGAVDLGGPNSNQVQQSFAIPPDCLESPLVFAGTRPSGAMFRLDWPAHTGRVYRVQESPFPSGPWRDLLAPITAATTQVSTSISPTNQAGRIRIFRDGR